MTKKKTMAAKTEGAEKLVERLKTAQLEYAIEVCAWLRPMVEQSAANLEEVIDEEEVDNLLEGLYYNIARGIAVNERWSDVKFGLFVSDVEAKILRNIVEGPAARLDEATERYLDHVAMGDEDMWAARELGEVRKWYLSIFTSRLGGEKEEIVVSRMPTSALWAEGELSWREKVALELREEGCGELAERLEKDPYIGVELAWAEVKKIRAQILMAL